MEKETKINFFLITGCIIIAAIFPGIAIAAFGITVGIGVCIFVLSCLPFISGIKGVNHE